MPAWNACSGETWEYKRINQAGRENRVSTFEQIKNAGMKQSVTITFSALPENIEEFHALEESELRTPFQAAALTICALAAFSADPEAGLYMLGELKGSSVLSAVDRDDLKERLEGKKYLPYSYFEGAVLQNGYRPATPYRISFTTNPYSFSKPGFVRVFVASGGAKTTRAITLRQQGEQWILWEYASLFAEIEAPEQEL